MELKKGAALSLRKGYKQTDIGLIPEDWDVVSINQSVDVLRGGSPRPIQDYLSSTYQGINWIKIGDTSSSSKFITSSDEKIIPDGAKYSRSVKPGDFLLSNSMSFGRPYILKIDGCIHDGWLVLQNYDRTFLTEYFYYSLLSRYVYIQYTQKASGSSVLNLNKELVKTVLVALPPTKAEQTAIASALSDMDDLINSLSTLIEKKKAIKQGAMQELLKPKEGWERKSLKELAKYRRGSFPQPYGLDKWYDDISGTPFVQVYDVDDNFKLKEETKRKISDEAKAMSVFIEKGSIIITLQGSIGRIAITQYDAYVDRTLLFFESFIVPFNKYFFALSVFLLFVKEKEIAPGGIIKTITKEALSSFTIAYPSIEEQDRIANIFLDIENEIIAIEQSLSKYQIIKQGMMQELLTGKIRLV